MAKITKAQAEVIKTLTDVGLKVILVIINVVIFLWVTKVILDNACTNKYSVGVLVFLEAVLTGSLFVMMRHFFWNRNSD